MDGRTKWEYESWGEGEPNLVEQQMPDLVDSSSTRKAVTFEDITGPESVSGIEAKVRDL